jgi:cobalt-zinc-cadmium resistance protein CzcA
MTASLATIGLIPAAISTGIGSDVQKPIAIVVIGGMIAQPILTLFVLPVVYSLVARRVPAAVSESELAAS